MNELCKVLLVVLASTSVVIDGSSVQLSERESLLVAHVEKSILLADKNHSKLTDYVLGIEGFTSSKVKHLLNNLCSLPRSRYLEVGVWKGATFTAALHGNSQSIQAAVAIDNWSEFAGTEREFRRNCLKCIADIPFRFYSEDSFTINIHKLFSEPVDIYFYDGHHSALSQERAFTHYSDILSPACIVLVDDWNWEQVQQGTRSAFEKLGYTVLFECALPAYLCGDRENWWNGLYVAVIRK